MQEKEGPGRGVPILGVPEYSTVLEAYRLAVLIDHASMAASPAFGEGDVAV